MSTSILLLIVISVLILLILYYFFGKKFGNSRGTDNDPVRMEDIGGSTGGGGPRSTRPKKKSSAAPKSDHEPILEEIIVSASPLEHIPHEEAVEMSMEPEESVEEMSDDGKSKDIGEEEPNPKINTVITYFGTNRNYKEDKDEFGSKIEPLTVGKCTITIPVSHKVGNIETPFMNLKFLENPEKHIVYKNTKILGQTKWLEEIENKMSAADNKTGFVFVHGFNVAFKDAAKRTAQMVYDLKFEGIPFFYSWPSAEKLSGYSKDEETSRLSEKYLKKYLTLLFNDSSLEKIYLIAHSMGSRGLSAVMKDMITNDPIVADKLEELILTAPDINAQIFKEEIVPFFQSKGKIITLYAASDDKALQASRKIHGYSRAGESGDNIVVTDSVETIDASGMDTAFLGHSYFSSSQTIITDIGYLIKTGMRADERLNLKKEAHDDQSYFWKFID